MRDIILLKLDDVGVFATAPYVSYHADDRAQRASERSELCTARPPPRRDSLLHVMLI